MTNRISLLTASLAAGATFLTWGGAHAQTDTPANAAPAMAAPTPGATADTSATPNAALNDTDKLFMLRAA